MKYRYNETLPADFAVLAQKCGARIPLKSAYEAIRNSLFTVGIFEEEQLVAFGRICGDGVLYYLVCDVMVAEEFRERYLEENILRELGDYLREHRRRESRVMIRTDRAYAEVCRKHGFKYVDEDYEVIMKG